MAFTVTARHSGTSGASGVQTLATGSTTPTANSLLVAFGGVQSNSHATAHSWQSPSGGSLSYTNIATSASFDWDGTTDFDTSCTLWRAAVGGSPSAHTVTFDAWSGTPTGYYGGLCCDVTGHDTTTPVLQSKTNGATTDSGAAAPTGTVTFDNALVNGSLVIVGFASGNDGVAAYASPTIGGQAMTQLFNQTGTFCHCGLWYRVIDGTESNRTITCSDLGTSIGNYAVAAVEIAAASGGGAVDLVIQDANIGIAADNVTITQVHALNIQESGITMTVDNVVITQNHLIIVQDAAIPVAAENLTISQHIQLAIDKAVMAMQADTSSFQQVHQISIHKAFLQTAADVVTLTGDWETGGVVTVADVQVQKLQTLTGTTGTISDLMHAYYGGLSGLSPIPRFSISDHQRVYWETQTGLTNRSLADLEKAFYDVQLVPSGSLADREYVYWSNL